MSTSRVHYGETLMQLFSAADRLSSYKPSLNASNDDVPPLTEFFELVHVADVIQQMIQLYYDEEIVSKEKKKKRFMCMCMYLLMHVCVDQKYR